MNRREAIRNIALASTATIFMTGCADQDVIEMLLEDKLILDRRHKNYLSRISETFLPLGGVSESMGEPVEFILTMLNDCHEQESISDFAMGFEQYKVLMKESALSIKKPEPEKIIAAVKNNLETQEPQKELVHFINTVKDLSVRFLKSSEHYMSEYMEFEMIPATYDPCRQI